MSTAKVLISSVKLDEKALLGYGADMLDEATLRRLLDHGVSLVTADLTGPTLSAVEGFAFTLDGGRYHIVIAVWEDEAQRRRTIRHELSHIIHDFPAMSWLGPFGIADPRERRAREAEEESESGGEQSGREQAYPPGRSERWTPGPPNRCAPHKT